MRVVQDASARKIPTGMERASPKEPGRGQRCVCVLTLSEEKARSLGLVPMRPKVKIADEEDLQNVRTKGRKKVGWVDGINPDKLPSTYRAYAAREITNVEASMREASMREASMREASMREASMCPPRRKSSYERSQLLYKSVTDDSRGRRKAPTESDDENDFADTMLERDMEDYEYYGMEESPPVAEVKTAWVETGMDSILDHWEEEAISGVWVDLHTEEGDELNQVVMPRSPPDIKQPDDRGGSSWDPPGVEAVTKYKHTPRKNVSSQSNGLDHSGASNYLHEHVGHISLNQVNSTPSTHKSFVDKAKLDRRASRGPIIRSTGRDPRKMRKRHDESGKLGINIHTGRPQLDGVPFRRPHGLRFLPQGEERRHTATDMTSEESYPIDNIPDSNLPPPAVHSKRLDPLLQEAGKQLFTALSKKRQYILARDLPACMPGGKGKSSLMHRAVTDRIDLREWMQYLRDFQGAYGEDALHDHLTTVDVIVKEYRHYG